MTDDFERFARNARVAVMLAQEEARELCDRETGSQHLLLGVLQAAGEELSAVLTGYGLTADVVRTRLAESSPGDHVVQRGRRRAEHHRH